MAKHPQHPKPQERKCSACGGTGQVHRYDPKEKKTFVSSCTTCHGVGKVYF